MLPLLAVAAAAGYAMGYAIARWLAKRLSGYRLVVIGPSRSGKTTLSTFLFTGKLPKATERTKAPTHMGQGVYRWPGGQGYVRWRNIADASGEVGALGQWKDIVQDAGHVLYVFRIDQLLNGEKPAATRITRDMKHLGDFLRGLDRQVTVIFVGTHADMMGSADANADESLLETMKANPTIHRAVLEVGGFTSNRFAVGSLVDSKRAESLAKMVVQEVTRK